MNGYKINLEFDWTTVTSNSLSFNGGKIYEVQEEDITQPDEQDKNSLNSHVKQWEKDKIFKRRR